MASSGTDHHDSLFAAVSFILVVMSVMLGGWYVMHKPSVQENVPAVSKVETGSDPTRVPVSAGDDEVLLALGTLKVAVPHDCEAYLTDSEGAKTGTVDGAVVNDIPFSDYTPDGIAQTVNWIVIEHPADGQAYTLTVTGTPERAMAVYGKNAAGYEDLELIEAPSDSSVHTYAISMKATAAADIITIQ